MRNLRVAPRYDFDRRTVTSNGVNDIWAVDLIDFAALKGGYVINCVDVYSRYAQSVKLTHKTEKEIGRGIKELIKLFGAKPNKIWSDEESGLKSFIKKDLDKLGVELYHTDNSYRGEGTHSVPIVERFNRTMKFYHNQYKEEEAAKGRNMNWAQSLVLTIKKYIPFYNNRIHSSIGRTPLEAYTAKYNKEIDTIQRINENTRKIEGKATFKIGQSIYLAKPEDKLRGKSELQFTKPAVKITGIKPTNPKTYTLEGRGTTAFYGKQFR